MVKAPRDCHRHGKHQEPSSICHVMGLGKNGPSPVAPDDNNGSTCRLGHRSIVGLGILGAGKDSFDLWINLTGQDFASKSDGCSLLDSVLRCKSKKDLRP